MFENLDDLSPSDARVLALTEGRILEASKAIYTAMMTIVAAETFAVEMLSPEVTNEKWAAWIDPIKSDLAAMVINRLLFVMTSGESEQ